VNQSQIIFHLSALRKKEMIASVTEELFSVKEIRELPQLKVQETLVLTVLWLLKITGLLTTSITLNINLATLKLLKVLIHFLIKIRDVIVMKPINLFQRV
jgi:hypothetical protein